MDFEKICKQLKKGLSEKRYIHSIGVMEKAGELAKIYNLDIEKAKVVGLMHDIAKEMTQEEINNYIKLNNIEIDEIEKIQPHLLHGKIGADICKKEYGFTEVMQKAILYHTTGNPDMDLFAKIIFIADKIEKNREYEGVEQIRELASKDIDKAIIKVLENSIIKKVAEQKIIHPNTVNTRNALLMQK